MTEISRFLGDDAGAVTIDWVTLTAGVLLVGMVVVFAIYLNGVTSAASTVSSTLSGLGVDLHLGDPLGCEDLGNC